MLPARRVQQQQLDSPTAEHLDTDWLSQLGVGQLPLNAPPGKNVHQSQPLDLYVDFTWERFWCGRNFRGAVSFCFNFYGSFLIPKIYCIHLFSVIIFFINIP